MGDGDVVVCTSLSKDSCIGTTISTAKPYATGTCNIHIQEVAQGNKGFIPRIGVTDSAGKNIAYHLGKELIDVGSITFVEEKYLF